MTSNYKIERQPGGEVCVYDCQRYQISGRCVLQVEADGSLDMSNHVLPLPVAAEAMRAWAGGDAGRLAMLGVGDDY